MRPFAPLLASVLLGLSFNAEVAPSTLPGLRVVPLTQDTPGRTGFTPMRPDQIGLLFTNTLDEWAGVSNRVLHNGSGVAAGDYDRDGRIDLLLCSLERG